MKSDRLQQALESILNEELLFHSAVNCIAVPPEQVDALLGRIYDIAQKAVATKDAA